jgi:RTX calcium-binding nonapeptide repeat (4 copies)/FG-GAP repeat
MPQFSASISLADLDGSNGFRIDGIDARDYAGFGIAAAGDINGDGFGDIVVGAPFADGGGEPDVGESYVVFGKSGGFAASLDLASLDGANGFRLDGVGRFDRAGVSVSASGDVNGDGIGDFLVGAYGANTSAGATYVVFGKTSGFAADLDLAALDGTDGFRIDGVDADDHSGYSVSAAGDVNGDGFGDIVIGAYTADTAGGADAGESYVVFGKASGFGAAFGLSALDGSNGFRIDGLDTFGNLGRAVSGAGDVNGDGFGDIIVGAHGAYASGDAGAGQSYVVFGKAGGFAPAFDLTALDGVNGFRIEGIDFADASGRAVSSAGDVNGDGFGDIIVGAYAAADEAGETYVVFGKASGFAAALDLSALDGTNGFRIDGIDVFDNSGRAVSSAGDVNGDGFDDILIGANAGDPGGAIDAGESYVVFGKASGFAPALDLATLDGDTGFRLDGIDADDYSGASVSAGGDVNGDGFADILIGSFSADPGGDLSAGETYVVFGHRALDAVVRIGTDRAQTINGGFGGDTINGLGGADTLIGWEGDDRIDGGLGDDIIDGGDGNDIIDGGAGADRLAGGNGIDFFTISAGSDSIAGGAGKDTLDFRALAGGISLDLALGTYSLPRGAGQGTFIEIEQLIMSNGTDIVTGSAARDVINLAKGSDRADGGAGADFITGGQGKDFVTGGEGADTFDFNAITDSEVNPKLRDTIFDFAVNVDKIDLEHIDAQAGTAGNQAFTAFLGTGAFTAEGQIRVFQSNTNAVIEVNTTGTAGAEMHIVLANVLAATLDFADFIA